MLDSVANDWELKSISIAAARETIVQLGLLRNGIVDPPASLLAVKGKLVV